jgi:hypothetical protein
MDEMNDPPKIINFQLKNINHEPIINKHTLVIRHMGRVHLKKFLFE